MDRFGKILTGSCYISAAVILAARICLIMFDWNDPTHMDRAVLALLIALILATLGKTLSSVLTLCAAQKQKGSEQSQG